ncbi:MAG: hypothetical protein ACRC92_25650, partial [Peptostreptococcaceae bacterium]
SSYFKFIASEIAESKYNTTSASQAIPDGFKVINIFKIFSELLFLLEGVASVKCGFTTLRKINPLFPTGSLF